VTRTVHECYWPGGFDPDSPSHNLAELWDDDSRIYAAWDVDGVQTVMRPYNDEENARAQEWAAAQARPRRRSPNGLRAPGR
jgi:hypothetical protein